MNLDTAAAMATIVGTIITVGATVLALLGKLRFRLPTKLSSIESRAFFVIAAPLIALPVISWGPKWGLAPTIANLLVIPSLPGFFEQTAGEEPASGTVGENIVFAAITVLGLMNFFAVVTIFE
jgi:hypothetical protein